MLRGDATRVVDDEHHEISSARFYRRRQYLIRMLLEGMLADLGYAVAVTVGTVAEVNEVATKGEFEVAILDINVGGKEIYPVVDILAKRRLPFVFVSGYGEASLDERYRAAPLCRNYSRPIRSRPRSQACFQSKTSASLVMNGSSVISSRNGVTEMRFLSSAARSLPALAPATPPRPNAIQ